MPLYFIFPFIVISCIIMFLLFDIYIKLDELVNKDHVNCQQNKSKDANEIDAY